MSHLPNGIHGVEYFANGAWQQAQMNSDMGQSYIIGGTTTGGTQFQIRVRYVADSLVNAGRVYNFSLPASCAAQCSPAYTSVTYTTGTGTGTPSPVPGSPTAPPASQTPPVTPPTMPPPNSEAPATRA